MPAAGVAAAIAAYYLSFQHFWSFSFDNKSVIAISAAATPAAFLVASLLPAGFRRLLALAPFFPSLLLLPRAFPASPLLRTSAASSWLIPLNLLRLSFQAQPEPSFPRFAASLLLSVRPNSASAAASSRASLIRHHLRPLLFSAFLQTTFFLLSHRFHRLLTRPLYCILTYFSITSGHHFCSILYLLLFGSTLLPIFDRPWLASSVTEFWSSRWNLTVHALLRETIYAPFLRLLWRSRRSSGGKPPLSARIPAVMLTFLASGLFHEIAYYCMTQAEALSWEVTAFFLIHGAAASLEIFLRRTRPKSAVFRLPHRLHVLLTQIFVFATALRFFYCSFDRSSTPFHLQCAAELWAKLYALFGQAAPPHGALPPVADL